MTTEAQLRSLVRAVHSHPDFYGCKIVYVEHGRSRTLHGGASPSRNYRTMVVIEVGGPGVPRTGSNPNSAVPTQAPGLAASNGSRLWPELVGLGLSCGLATISVLGVVGSVAAEPVTAGGSSVVLLLSWTGVATGGVQCLNGMARVGEALFHPDDSTLSDLDDNEAYQTSMLIIDGIGVASGLGGLKFSLRSIATFLQRKGSLPPVEALQAMPAEVRRSTVEKALKAACRTSEDRAALFRALQEAGLKDHQIQRALGNGVKTGPQVAKAVAGMKAFNAEAARRLNLSIRDALGGAGGAVVSATPSGYTGSASGSVNWLIVHIIQLVDEAQSEKRPSFEKATM